MHRLLICLMLACCALWLRAEAVLTGSWGGEVAGQAVSLSLNGKGGGSLDGKPIRYQVMGGLLLIEEDGEVTPYQFRLQGGQLLIAGGDIPGVLSMIRVKPGQKPPRGNAARPQAGGLRQELVGSWCLVRNFSASGGGGSQSSTCFELRPDGSYSYSSERSMDAYGGGMWGGTSSSSSDSGRWTATGNSLTAHSHKGGSTTYPLEKRNHPRNHDPMLCLDGDCYVTQWQRAPW